MKKFLFTVFITILLITILPFFSVRAFNLPAANYPRLVNLFWRTPITQDDAKSLAHWDMLVLDMQAQNDSADAIRYLRQLNPKIIILAYTSANEIPLAQLKIKEPSGAGLWHDLAAAAKPQWQLKTTAGENISWWPGNISMNLCPTDESGKTYADYLVDFFGHRVLATGLWDGLLFDNVWQDVSWVNPNLDIDGDGQADSASKINNRWQISYKTFFQKLRDRWGDRYLIVGNGDGAYHAYLNGRMFEGFPEIYEGGWAGSMTRYQDNNANGYRPRVNIVNSDSNNTGNSRDYQTMRFGLTSTLLFNGYYSFDYGTQLREQFWWYDEYDAKLGQPKSEPFNLLNRNNQTLAPGVWQRDFTGGMVLVNSTDQTQKIEFDAEYEKIHGLQDPVTNDGAKINQVTIPARDGLMLYRPISQITGQTFVNGSFARVFDQAGKNIRTGFFAYDQRFRGQNKIINIDANGDGQMETIVADKSTVAIYRGLEKITSFQPYGANYNQGISLAVADINGDGKNEIITGSEGGGGNLIKIFNWYGQVVNHGWHAYNKIWPKLGVHVAAGDINGDGVAEIMAGAGLGGGPHVKIFDKNGKLQSEFFAYGVNFRGGVNVAAGDANGDGKSEIITGAGLGGGPHVRIWNGQGKMLNEWFAYGYNKRGGVAVAAADIDDDGQAEIFGLTTEVFTTSMINSKIQISAQ